MHQVRQKEKRTDHQPLVYVINPPAKYIKGRMTLLDFDLGEDYGKLNVIFPGPERPPPLSEAKETIATIMKGYKRTDRIVLAGDMDLVVYAVLIASKQARVTLLKWHSKFYQYEEIEL